MKKALLFIAAVFTAMTFTACSNDDENQVIVPITPVAADGFSWQENGAGALKTAATASFSTQYKTLIAKDASNATVFEINLDGTAAATYAVDANNAITYAGVNPYFTATSGSVIVTANAGGKISGTFSAAGNAAGITAISGTFKNITVVP